MKTGSDSPGGKTMRKIVLALVLVGGCLALSGCWFFDAEHNRSHWKIIKKDIRAIHEDLDFILALEEESPLAESYYR